MNIEGLSKPAVLAALFNASKQQGMGFMDSRGASSMSEEDAAEVIVGHMTAGHGMCFDYLRGRIMKINIQHDDVNTWGYDRDNGEGAAERAIQPLREKITA